MMPYFKPQLESGRRTIHTCYAYSPSGRVNGADTEISCPHSKLGDWTTQLFDLAVTADSDTVQAKKTHWLNQQANTPILTQTYRRITYQEALMRLKPKRFTSPHYAIRSRG